METKITKTSKRPNSKWRRLPALVGSLFLGLAFTALTPNTANAQADCYSFSQFIRPYVPLSGGNVFQSGTGYSTYYQGRPLGFSFDYMNGTYTTCDVYIYGYLKFSTGIYNTTNIFSAASTNANDAVAPLNYIHYPNSALSDPSMRDATIGVAPNRVYVCEVRDHRTPTNLNTEKINFQYRLYEGTNVVEMHYGEFATTYNYGYYIGIRGGINDYHVRQSSGSWLQSTKATTYTYTRHSPTSGPPSGLVYKFQRFNTLTANFVAPGQAYVDAIVKYTSSNPGFNIEWDRLDDNTVESTADEYVTTYSTAGTYTMRMVAYNCILADTIKKDIVIVNPTAAPVADFVAYDNDILIYEQIQIFDLSTQGPNFWDWLVYDSADSANTVYQQTGNDPFNDASIDITSLYDGKYTVCLRAGNSLGFSTQVCKYDYITVNPVTIISMGPIKSSDVTTGTLTDNGGPDFNYSNGRYDDFTIATCNADSIVLTFNHFKVADNGDRLLIYDGANANGKPFHTGTNGFDADNPPPKELVATSGAMFFYFITNGSGTDSGFSATWTTKLGPSVPPAAGFQHADTIYTGVPTTIKNATFARGEVFHTWTIQGDPIPQYTQDLEDYTFVTSGNRNVCLKDSTCVGKDEFCKNVFVYTPVTPIRLDFEADQRRVKANEDVVTLTALTDQATDYEWTFFPTTVDAPITNQKEIQVRFLESGPYTITLKAWNSVGGQANTQKIVLKDDYVIAVEYCQPSVQVVSTDIGLERVVLKTKPAMGAPVTLIDNETTTGETGFSDYTEDAEVPAAELYFGVEYDLTLRRPTPAVNPVNRKAWIDFNIDGQFDATENIFSEAAGNAVQRTESFTVPTLDESFAGITRLRASAVYSNQVNNGCGTGNGGSPLVGEYEDYRVDLTVDPDKPVITLIGDDTVFVEVDKSYTELGATVMDGSQGDITGNLVITGEVDTTQTSIYRLVYSAKDASGNEAELVTRVVMVVVDNTAPEIKDLGTGDETIEVFSEYTDPGVTANDAKDGDLTTAVMVENNLDNTKLGTYTIVYKVSDNQGNTATFVRNITVVDTEKPEILALGSDNVQVGSAFVDMTTVTDNYDNNPTFTVTGEIVNPNVIGEYQVTYTAMDASGNVADVLVRTYKVNDFIAPNFNLGSTEAIIHDVRTPFVDPTTIESLEENYYPLSQVKITRDLSQIDVNTIGTYTMSVTASDPSGNTKTITRDVKVVDRKAPVLFGAFDVEIQLYDTTFWPFSGLKVEDNYDPPSVLLPRIEAIDNNVNVYKEGLYHVTFRVTDLSGNVSVPVERMVRVCADCETTLSTNTVELGTLNVYPNPSTGVFAIEFALNNTEDVTVEIYNSLGAVVENVEVGTTNRGNLTVDLSAQPAGIYSVRLITANGVINKKVIITE